MSKPFRSPVTNLPYLSLADLYPGLPESRAERNKLFAAARNELWSEESIIGPWDIAFVALINRQVEILEKAKTMLREGKFHICFRGDPESGACYINEFEICTDVPSQVEAPTEEDDDGD